MQSYYQIFDEKIYIPQNRDYVRCGIICQFVPPLRPEEIDELEQTTFMKAWKGLPGFRGDADVRSWLYRIAENAAKDYLVKFRHFIVNVEDAAIRGGIEALRAEEIVNPFEHMKVLQIREAYYQVFGNYHPKCRAVLEMVENEIPYKQIAAQFDWNEYDVRNLVFAFKKKLRTRLKEAGALQ